MNRFALAGAAAATIVAVVLGGAYLLGPRPPDVGASPSPTPATAVSPSPARATPSAPLDYSTLPGRILVEHLGNAIDGSEMPTTEYNPDRRRFYFMNPADMTGAAAVEFLPGQPSTGKSAADVSLDGRKVVFQDWSAQPRLYEANLDGTGFHQLPVTCDCQLLYPDYDPTAIKVVYVRIEGAESWLEILDLETEAITRLETTLGSSADSVPEQPAWSPDGKTIAFSRLTWNGAEPAVGTVRYGNVPPTSGVLSLLDVATGGLTDLPVPATLLPGDANWSPDSLTIVFSGPPASTTGSVGGMPPGGLHLIEADGTNPRDLPGWGGPEFLPDGNHILYQANWFYLVRPDGTDDRPLNARAMDLSDLAQGFTYIGHWIDEP